MAMTATEQAAVMHYRRLFGKHPSSPMAAVEGLANRVDILNRRLERIEKTLKELQAHSVHHGSEELG